MTDVSSPKEMIRSLYDSYSNDVYRYAWAALGDSTEAHDVVQEVFLRAYRSLSNYRNDASAKTWLMTITRNYIFDVLRKRRTERKYLSQYEVPEVSDDSTSLDVVMEVREALSQLKDTYRQVLILRYVENFSSIETSHILGWSETKVRTTAHRAIAKLRESLGVKSEEVKFNHGV